MKIPNEEIVSSVHLISLARIVSEDSQPHSCDVLHDCKSSKDS